MLGEANIHDSIPESNNLYNNSENIMYNIVILIFKEYLIRYSFMFINNFINITSSLE